jgi:hypothetical protein
MAGSEIGNTQDSNAIGVVVQFPCSACGGCGMLPGKGPNDDVMNTPCPECNEWARHDQAWQKSFITPIAREMKKRGVAYLLITIRDDGKAAFVIEPNT